jgi:RNA polymerase sigma-70 factor (ECF subfamily)
MDSDDGLLYVQIREAIDRCRPVDREALKLVFWEELSHAEAATVLGCSVNAFEIRFRRARQRVRDELAVPNASSKSNEPRSIKTSEARRIYPS